MIYTVSEAIQKMQAWCAYQDRAHDDVRKKLSTFGIYAEEAESVIISLIEDNFLNEERFARSFARGKFRINKWGRIKITYALRSKKIPETLIRISLQEIDSSEYLKTISELIQKNWKGKKHPIGKDLAALLRKIASRGFEPNLIRIKLKEMYLK